MERIRKAFLVFVDLDPVPGTMNTPESATFALENILRSMIPHYNPHVTLAPESDQPISISGQKEHTHIRCQNKENQCVGKIVTREGSYSRDEFDKEYEQWCPDFPHLP